MRSSFVSIEGLSDVETYNMTSSVSQMSSVCMYPFMLTEELCKITVRREYVLDWIPTFEPDEMVVFFKHRRICTVKHVLGLFP